MTAPGEPEWRPLSSRSSYTQQTFAHSANSAGEWHSLHDHLESVAALSAQFASAFRGREYGYWVGLWHDLGKFSPEFQQYLQNQRKSVDHRRAGAKLALSHLDMAALVIQGHHGGLKAKRDFTSWLEDPHRSNAEREESALRQAMLQIEGLTPTSKVPVPASVDSILQAEVFLRLLFSALVDADYLDTEAHFSPGKANSRGAGIRLDALWSQFQISQGMIARKGDDSPVNLVRREIYADCIAAAGGPPGFYRLTAPTGAGKTLSAMGFALRHAMQHGLHRVIVATPLINITEQTSAAYRSAFRSLGHAVLEHHSGGFGRDPDLFQLAAEHGRLAAENWDAPIIVSTAVQLFESLFANSPSRCRKVHRMTRSVLVLDEAQALPTHLLDPILSALKSLTTVGQASVLLTTATQPAFEVIPVFRDIQPREIVSDPRRHFCVLRRVKYEWRTDEPWTWDRVAREMQSSYQALTIVNTRADALELLDALDSPNALHLSTRLCGAHRLSVIEEVKRRLRAAEPCQLVATQVVEAGVDLDFPLVLRALGPLDSIVQAAGRCNREGNLGDRGRVVVFQPIQGRLPGGAYKTATEITRALMNAAGFEPEDPGQTAETYFEQLLATLSLDSAGIQEIRNAMDFPEVADRFRMIDAGVEAVAITSYGTDAERTRVQGWLDDLGRGRGNARHLRRRLQPYLVTLYPYEAQQYRSQGHLPAASSSSIPGWTEYDPVRGLVAPERTREVLIV